MGQAATMTVGIRAFDVSRQKSVQVRSVSNESTVAELVKRLVRGMGLVPESRDGQPLEYRARLEREGRQLRGAERVGEALRDDDELVISPRIQAG